MDGINFNEYYKKLNGFNITINFDNRFLVIYKLDGSTLKKLWLAASVPKLFNLSDMFKTNTSVGELKYFVFENGFQNKDWLFASEHGMTL